MTIYRVQGPDGRVHRIEGPENATPEDIEAYAARIFAPKEQAGFWQSFKETASGLKKSGAEAAQFGISPTGDEASRAALLAAQESPTAKTAASDIKDVSSGIDWAKQTVGSSMGYLFAPAAAGVAAKMARAPVPLVRAIGLGTLGAQYLADNLGRQAAVEEQAAQAGEPLPSRSVTTAGLAAAGQTGLDVLGFHFFRPLFSKFPILGKLMGAEGKASTEEAKDILVDAFRNGKLTNLRGVTQGMGKGIVFEVPQEIAQQFLERAQAGLPLADQDARHEYFEAGAGALLVGGGLGGVGNFMNNRAKISEAQEIIRLRNEAREKAREDASRKAREAHEALSKAEKEAIEKTEGPAPPASLKKAPAAPLVSSGAITPESLLKLSMTTAQLTKGTIEKAFKNGEALTPEEIKLVDDITSSFVDEKGLRLFGPGFSPPNKPTSRVWKPKKGIGAEIFRTQAAAHLAEIAKAKEATGQVGEANVETKPIGTAEPARDAGVSGPATTTGATPEATGRDGVVSTPTGGSDVGYVQQRTAKGQGALTTEPAPVANVVIPPESPVTGERVSPPALETKPDKIPDYIDISERINYLKKKVTSPALVLELVNIQEELDEKGKPQNKDKKAARAAIISKLDNIEQSIKEPIQQIDRQQAALDESEQRSAERVQEEIERERAREGLPPETLLMETVRSGDANNIIDTLGSMFKNLKDRYAGIQTTETLTPAQIKKQQAEILKVGEKMVRKKLPKAIIAAKIDALRDQRATRTSLLTNKEIRKVGVLEGLVDALSSIDFSDTKIQIEGDPNTDAKVFAWMRKEGHLGLYDPKTDTIYLTPDGMTRSVILHEFVHAATVKVLRQYEVDPSKLDPEQREAVEHLQKIFAVAKRKLAPSYPRAFDSIYEFISYAMTSDKMQRDLAKLRAPSLKKYTVGKNVLKGLSDMWSQLTEALANMFGLYRHKKMTSEESEKAPPAKKAADIAEIRKYVKEQKTKGKKLTFAQAQEQLNAAQRERSIKGFHETSAEANVLLEISEAFSRILSKPEAGVDVGPLAASRVYAAPGQYQNAKEVYAAGKVTKETTEAAGDKLLDKFETLTNPTVDIYENAKRVSQNSRAPLKFFENFLIRSNKIVWDVAKSREFNAIYSAIVGSAQKSWHALMTNLHIPMEDMNDAVVDFAKAENLTPAQAMDMLSAFMLSIHVPIRRYTKFLLNVPLDTEEKFSAPSDVEGRGRMDSAAGHRHYMLQQLQKAYAENSVFVMNKVAARYGKVLKNIVEANNPDGSPKYRSTKITAESTLINTKTGKPMRGISFSNAQLNSDDSMYDITGTVPMHVWAEIKKDYETAKLNHPKIMQKFEQNFRLIQNKTIELNKQANYWSQPVDNFKEFYGWGDNYVSLAGRPDSMVSQDDDRFEFGSKRHLGGYEYIEYPKGWQGRISDSENVVVQTLNDGAKAAMRVGRMHTTLALRNLVRDTKERQAGAKHYINGAIFNIPFEDRYKDIVDELKLKGENLVFHYNADGSIDVIRVDDQAIRESIRRVYRQPQPVWQWLNKWTSAIGHMHTRYNLAFHPYNFVRDALTNSFNIGAEFGPKAMLDNIARIVSDKGLFKAAKFSKLYHAGKTAEINALAAKDPYYKHMLRWAELGGRTAFIQALSIKGIKTNIIETSQPTNIQQTKIAIDKLVDTWADSFEYASRVASFMVVKEQYLAKNPGMSEQDAEYAASTFVKELANFESVGVYGREAGALFMFFRPAATGAFRAMDALMPIFVDVETMINRMPEALRNDQAAVTKYRQEYAQLRDNASKMLYGLLGVGFMLYMMAWMLSDEEEGQRNRVATDDMAQWVRNLRIPLGSLGGPDNKFLQLPWGFGLGSFMSMGAQIGAMGFGNTSLRDSMGNMINIALDSFVPLPISRISPTDKPLLWVLDSIAPSLARPVLEFTWNTDSLGRKIYSDRISRYGEPYSGTESSAEMFNDTAQFMARLTNGDVAVSPTSLAFWTNNYVDGVARAAYGVYGLGLVLGGDKALDVKKDLPVLSSYIGRKSSIDAREFAKIEDQILEKRNKLNMFKNRPGENELYIQYMKRHPNDEMLIYKYNKISSILNLIRKERNRIQAMPNITSKERKIWVDNLTANMNAYKRMLVDDFETYNITP